MKSFVDGDLEIIDADRKFSYLPEITATLDNHHHEVDAAFIKNIVLWKLNRFPEIDDELLAKLRQIPRRRRDVGKDLISDAVYSLTRRRGFGLPMASAVLRFINPKAFQIIDRRAYRVLTGDRYREPRSPEAKSELYINYLCTIRELCRRQKIQFSQVDRVLYELDKRLNKDVPLYGR